MSIVQLDDATFDDVVAGSDVPVLVEFTAAWCPPCKAIEPVLDQLATEHAGRLVVGQVDVDQHPQLQRRHDVYGLPTLVLFVDGVPERRLVGARAKGRLLQELGDYV
jgi:thioredoxin 1